MIDLQDGFAEVNGVCLHYVRAGSGPLVLLLHGFPEFWYSWRHQIPALAQTHTVVALDQRGYNLSSRPQAVSAYRIEELMGDVRALIPHLGFDTATIVGHDWGGAVAWSFAARYPALVERLAVLNLPHPAVMSRGLRRNPRQLLRSWYMFFFQLPRLPERVLSANNFARLEQSFHSWVTRSDVFTPEDMALYRRAWSQPGAVTAMLNWYRAGLRYDLFANSLYSEILRMPTLLIWGTNDRALGQELTYGTERYVPDLRIRYLPGVSHWVQQEGREDVNALLAPFVQGQL